MVNSGATLLLGQTNEVVKAGEQLSESAGIPLIIQTFLMSDLADVHGSVCTPPPFFFLLSNLSFTFRLGK